MLRHSFPSSALVSGSRAGVPDNGCATEIEGTTACVDPTTSGGADDDAHDNDAHEEDEDDDATGMEGGTDEDAEDEDGATEKGAPVKDAKGVAEDDGAAGGRGAAVEDAEIAGDKGGGTDDKIESSNEKDGVVDESGTAEDGGGAEDVGRGGICSVFIPLKGGDPNKDSDVEEAAVSERDGN